MARQRASGVGSNSRRFAEIQRPDGKVDKVPAAKDAATYLYLANDDGSWPKHFTGKALYDATWMTEGRTLKLIEKRPGKGMGEVTWWQVVEVVTEIDIYPNGHMQIRRLCLADQVEDYEDWQEQVSDDRS